VWPCAGNRISLIFLVTFCIKAKSDWNKLELKVSRSFEPNAN